MSPGTVTPAPPQPRMLVDEPARLSADFLFDLGQLLERHGYAPSAGVTVPFAVGHAYDELAAFVTAYRAASPTAGRV